MKPEPFRIEPIFSPRIWGSRSLAPLFPEKTNLAEPIGEAWLTGVDCRVVTGPFAGKTLGEAWREMPAEWRGEKFKEPGDFPLLVKFIFPTDKLSIQVHPDDAYASVHEKAAGGRGKTEMWYVVSAEPGAQVLIGLKPGVNKEKFLEGLQAHKLEELFVAHAAREGDTFFLPAGTPHTIGPGMVLCEVQQYSDLTYRVYDYGRLDALGKPRELHIEKALAVTKFWPTNGGRTCPLLRSSSLCNTTLLAACRYFVAELLEPTILQSSTEARHFVLLLVLSGSGVFDGPGFEFPYHRGECWFLPANLGQYCLIPGAEFPAKAGQYLQSGGGDATKVIFTYVADLSRLKDQLLQHGFKEELSDTFFD